MKEDVRLVEGKDKKTRGRPTATRTRNAARARVAPASFLFERAILRLPRPRARAHSPQRQRPRPPPILLSRLFLSSLSPSSPGGHRRRRRGSASGSRPLNFGGRFHSSVDVQSIERARGRIHHLHGEDERFLLLAFDDDERRRTNETKRRGNDERVGLGLTRVVHGLRSEEISSVRVRLVPPSPLTAPRGLSLLIDVVLTLAWAQGSYTTRAI